MQSPWLRGDQESSLELLLGVCTLALSCLSMRSRGASAQHCACTIRWVVLSLCFLPVCALSVSACSSVCVSVRPLVGRAL